MQRVNHLLEQRHWRKSLGALACMASAYTTTNSGTGTLGGFDEENVNVTWLSRALLAPRLPWLSRAHPYLSQLGFSFSFFLMWVPGIAETLTRLPVSHPLAEGPQSPLVRGALATWFALFLVGCATQLLWIRSQRRAQRAPARLS